MKKLSFNKFVLGAAILGALSLGAQADTVYLSTSYNSKMDPSSQLSIHSDGKVYDSNGKHIGHLTDSDGKSLNALPANGSWEIRTRSGKIIGANSTSVNGIDSSRSMQVSQESSGSVAEKSAATPDNAPNTGNRSGMSATPASASGNVGEKSPTTPTTATGN